MVDRSNPSTATQRRLQRLAEVPAPAQADPEPESMMPTVLVTALVLCFLLALSGTLGLLLHMVLRRLI